MILFDDEIVSSKYTTILIKSLFVLYSETTKMLIFGVLFCIILSEFLD